LQNFFAVFCFQNNSAPTDGIRLVIVITRRELIVVGAGPAGIVAAIAAQKRGQQVIVLDARKPPIDKPCGEGILPQGVAALRTLGISLPAGETFPFRGIRFADESHSARADFADEAGLSVRRVKLHQLLTDYAMEAGVEFRWESRVTQIDERQVTTAKESFSYDWLIGADGHNSRIRKWAGLEPRAASKRRFGFCSHYQLEPWSDVAEVHWAHRCQIFITPMRGQEVGVAVISRDPQLRFNKAIQQFPFLANKLCGAAATTRELGDTTGLIVLPRVTNGRIALIGDASGTVDAVTGHGLSLSFQQALSLAESMQERDLRQYEHAHKKIASLAITMTRLMMLMSESDWIRRRTLRLFQITPRLFTRMLAIHTGSVPLSTVGVAEIADFGWRFLRA
jgi:flavin-dependent dehydrogenase